MNNQTVIKVQRKEKLSIIKTAAKILKTEILSSEVSMKALYPSLDEISAQDNMKYVPESLQVLLKTIFSGKDVRLKIISIGQSIVQAAAPRMFMVPLQLALGVQLHQNLNVVQLLKRGTTSLILLMRAFCSM